MGVFTPAWDDPPYEPFTIYSELGYCRHGSFGGEMRPRTVSCGVMCADCGHADNAHDPWFASRSSPSDWDKCEVDGCMCKAWRAP
jgi:hypothetical protein